MHEWYDGYRFAKNADGDVYNTDMVLYYLKHSVPNEPMPDNLIDTNVRIDYTKLRHLLVLERRLNGNFDLLRHVIGEGQADADPSPGIPLDQLDQPEHFLSLLYYFGLLSIRGVSGGTARLGIPNQTVRRLMYGYLRDAYRDVGVFSVSHYHFAGLVRDMAYRGAWRPALEFIGAAIAEQTGIRDYIDGEKVVHAFLAAHFSVVGHFLIHCERELNKGYADLHLEPFLARYPDVAYGYVVELKYLKRSETVDAGAVAEKMGRGTAATGALPGGRRIAAAHAVGAAPGSGGGLPRLGDGGVRGGGRGRGRGRGRRDARGGPAARRPSRFGIDAPSCGCAGTDQKLVIHLYRCKRRRSD